MTRGKRIERPINSPVEILVLVWNGKAMLGSERENGRVEGVAQKDREPAKPSVAMITAQSTA